MYSDTGSWKQTALRVALFSEPTPEYPMTLLQRHPDAIITATVEIREPPHQRESGLAAFVGSVEHARIAD